MPDCLFCRMIRKEVKASIAFEDDHIFAIHDINPQAPHHLLVIPKKHIERIDEMEASDIPILGQVIFQAQQIATQNHWKDFRLVFNNGTGSGQSVFHIHLHLLAGRRMTWPPG